MNLVEATKSILDGEALLFLGTGFSNGAKNMRGEDLLSPKALAHLLYSLIGVSEDEINDDLSQASELYQDSKGDYELVNLLKDLYTISSVSDEQRHICKKRWIRVYTTNYDNVIEKSYEDNHRILHSAVLSQNPSLFSNKDGMCVHLNGSILSLSPDKLGSEFKLTDKSYLADSFISNEWMSIFQSDLRTAKAVFFIGYSMKYDLELKRVFFNTKGTHEKTFFIVSPSEPQLSIKSLEKYGSVLPIGLSGFVEELKNTEKNYRHVVSYNPVFFSFDKIVIPATPPVF